MGNTQVKGNGELSLAELERLKSYERSGRLSEVGIELFDFWTDVAFAAVLYVYSTSGLAIDYSDPLIGILTSTSFSQCDINFTPPPDRNIELFGQLFVACVIVLMMNLVVRTGMCLVRLYESRGNFRVEGLWFIIYSLIAVVATNASPHNGLFFIEDMMLQPKGLDDSTKEMSDDDVKDERARLTRFEVAIDGLTIMIEDFPQLVIQAVFFFGADEGDLPIAFFLATLVTLLSLIIELGSMFFNIWKLSQIGRICGGSASGGASKAVIEV